MADLVKMHNAGITIFVPEKDVDRYKRAGYSVVASTPAEAPVETPASVEETEDPAPAEAKRGKKN